MRYRIGLLSDVYMTTYPSKRLLVEQTIRTWFSDASANGEISLLAQDRQERESLVYQMRALEDAGLVTFTKPSMDAARNRDAKLS